MIIRTLLQHEAAPLNLLLLADPSQEQVETYIANGACRVAEVEGEIVGVYVLIRLDDKTMEIMNIAVDEQMTNVSKMTPNA